MFKFNRNTFRSINLKDKIRIFLMTTMCISFLFFSMATNQVYKNLFKKNTKELMSKNFNLTYSNLEKMVDNAKNVCTIIENNDLIYSIISAENDLTSSPDSTFYEQYNKYINMQNTIVFTSSTYDMDGITIYTKSGCVYGDNGKTYYKINEINNSKWYKFMEENKENTLFCNSSYFSDNEQAHDGNLYYIKRICSKNNGKYLGAIRVKISAENINNLLYQNAHNSTNTTYLLNSVGEYVTNFDSSKFKNIEIKPTPKQSFTFDGKTAIIHQNLAGTNLSLVCVMSYKDAIADFNKIQLLIYFITLIMLFLSYKLSKVFAIGITKRLSLMMDSMSNVKNGVFQPVPLGKNFDDIEECINNYNNMLSEFNTLLETQKEHEAQKRDLQLKILQEQIKPHFLYNTLELINNSAIINNIPEVSQIVLELSSFYRLSLNQGSEIHTLKEEIQHISLYFSLQNKRAQKNLKLEICVPDELLNIKIPKMLLQPIMENAYYHAFPNPICKDNSKIEVSAKKVDDNIIIEFIDNGVGIPYNAQKFIFKNESKNSFGLKNINERIKLFYGNNYGLNIYSVPDEGTTITLKLPYILE